MDDPRVCIVGAGHLSSFRIYPYIGQAGGVIAGVCDLDRDKAERNARRFGGRVYTDLSQMIEAESPDAVLICIGPEAHAALAPKVMELGIPVYTEKPPAPTAREALEVARVSARTRVVCSTAFKKRYNVAYTRAKQWLEGFNPDDYFSISADYCSAPYANDSPRTDFLLDFAVHIIDLVSYLFGDASEVFAFARGKDAYAVSIRFESGAVGSLNLNDGRSFTIPTEELELTVRGGNFMSIHNSSTWRISEQGKCTEWREPPTFASSGDSGNDTGHLAELVDFFQAIREGRSTRSNIYESYKSMVLYEAIRSSAETGNIIQPEYQPL